MENPKAYAEEYLMALKAVCGESDAIPTAQIELIPQLRLPNDIRAELEAIP